MKYSKSQAFNIAPGSEILLSDQRHVILRFVDTESVEVQNVANSQVRKVPINSLDKPIISKQDEDQTNIHIVPKEEWKLAQERYSAIKPLLGLEKRTRGLVADRAKECKVHVNTLYKWIAAFERTGLVSSLLNKSRSDKGSKKLSSEVEEIIDKTIQKEYLNRQKKSMKRVCDEVMRICFRQGFTPPHGNTVRNRIKELKLETIVRSREGHKKANYKFNPIRGNFPNADTPLSVVQIDHTKVDIILVDDLHRLPVGRPWITLAIDVFSRMVLGFYISFDPPGALSTGLCIAHMILPKENWLLKLNIDDQWPCWGIPNKIHVDNAKEFRGNMLKRACEEYGIDLEWRPVARPHFGGHIERLLGTLAKEIHTLPGTTFSNITERGNYPSEKKAVFTLSEFETWLTNYIVKIYHKKEHSTIKTSPLERFNEGVFGNETTPGIGLQAHIMNEEKLRLDFTPYVERSIKPYGVQIDQIHYFHDRLRPWMNAKDPRNHRLTRKFMFRIDPRDISQIWFYDPEMATYYPIPFRDTSKTPISIWELRAAKKRLKDKNSSIIDEDSLFRAHEELREIEEKAQKKTSSYRRNKQRRSYDESPNGERVESGYVDPSLEQIDLSDLEPFDEMVKI